MTWVVWLDKNSKWHCNSVGWVGNSLANDDARRMAQVLTGQFFGTDAELADGVVAYCVHAPTRARATKLGKQAERKAQCLNQSHNK